MITVDNLQVRYQTTLNGHRASDVDLAAFRCTSAGYGHHPQIVQCRHCGYVMLGEPPEPMSYSVRQGAHFPFLDDRVSALVIRDAFFVRAAQKKRAFWAEHDLL